MKALVLAAGAIVLLTSSAQAEGTAPWCAVISTGFANTVWDCRYRSIEHCRPNVIAGNRGFCVPNFPTEPVYRRSRGR
jgi:hypothetical protein